MLYDWLNNHFPPKMIKGHLIERLKEFGGNFVAEADRQRLVQWIDSVEKRFALTESNKSIMRKFQACLNEIRDLLSGVSPKL